MPGHAGFEETKGYLPTGDRWHEIPWSGSVLAEMVKDNAFLQF